MLRRFQIELSDIDRGVYESLDFRVAQHPSETTTYLITRTLAFALSYQSNLEFTAGGLGDPESPALRALGDTGTMDLWIEIGNPSARKLHKANKVAKHVVVYTYKNIDMLIAEIQSNNVHKADEIDLYSFDQTFVGALESTIEKNNKWSVLLQDGQLSVQVGDQPIMTQITKYQVKK